MKKNIYTIKSKILKLRSRSWFKIEEINKKEKIFKNNFNIIDLGSYPGGWCQYLINNFKNNKIFACDIYEMKKINNVYFLQGDILNNNIYNNFINIIKKNNINNIDIIISDMCPKLSGYNSIDIYKMIDLINISIKLCIDILKYNGSFIFKIFNNNKNKIIFNKIDKLFKYIKIIKLKTSKKNLMNFI